SSECIKTCHGIPCGMHNGSHAHEVNRIVIVGWLVIVPVTQHSRVVDHEGRNPKIPVIPMIRQAGPSMRVVEDDAVGPDRWLLLHTGRDKSYQGIVLSYADRTDEIA